ncbi:unnamed protein product, partial [Effrenium voratum]
VQLQLSGRDAKAESFSVARLWGAFRAAQRGSGLWPGLGPATLRAGSYGGLRLGLCEPLQAACGSAGAGAAAAGVAATVLGNPLEVLKVRLQATGTSKGNAGHVGAWQVLRSLLAAEGPRALLRGFGWAASRSALLTASQAHAKSALQSVVPEGAALHVAASLAAGVVTTTVTAPVDVLKTQAMSAEGGQQSIGALLRAEGPFVFFKGWLANYVRLGPQTLFIFVFYEQARGALERLRS